MEALRAQALEQARAEVKEQHAQAMRKALQEQGEKLAADRKAAEAHAAEQAKKEAERKARKQVAQAKAEAAQAAEKKLAEEREAARRDQEERDRADLEAARQEAAEARAQAEETARKLQLTASEESIRFAMLFEQLQGAAGAMMDLVDALTAAGRAEEAGKNINFGHDLHLLMGLEPETRKISRNSGFRLIIVHHFPMKYKASREKVSFRRFGRF